MAYSSNLRCQLESMKKTLFQQGYLDEQFLQLEELQDEESPNFVEEVVRLFFTDSTKLISNVEQALENSPRDFRRLDVLMHQLKGSSSSIGAFKVKRECSLFREHCSRRDLEGCSASFQNLKREHAILKQKLEAYLQAVRQLEM